MSVCRPSPASSLRETNSARSRPKTFLLASTGRYRTPARRWHQRRVRRGPGRPSPGARHSRSPRTWSLILGAAVGPAAAEHDRRTGCERSRCVCRPLDDSVPPEHAPALPPDHRASRRRRHCPHLPAIGEGTFSGGPENVHLRVRRPARVFSTRRSGNPARPGSCSMVRRHHPRVTFVTRDARSHM